MNYIIVNIADNELCWSNSDGWVVEGYDTFTEFERANLSLPIDGAWEAVNWLID
jgi:hypothetical protein